MMRKTLFLIAAMVLAAAAGLAATDDYNRIARVSHLDGHVSFQNPDDVDWSAASVNMALQPGDRLYTGEGGRAEIEVDDGSVLHLAENTDLELMTLNEDLVQVRVLTGLVTLTLRSTIGYEISTPAAVFNTARKGVYRFDVVESGDTDAIVRKGLLEAANDTFSRQIEAGELIHVTPGEQSTANVSRYLNRDEWDEWTDRQDADYAAYDSRKYVPDNVYMGVSDLDAYGRWVVVDAYGPAWVPNMADAAWSPYNDGRWWYRPVWGWTWVSYEPWGWLPYHYGRWYHHHSYGWCWLPGVSFGFHFWSPGLVRFYQGPSWVSWCPLGPGDYYNVNNYYYSRTYSYYVNNLRLLQRRGPEDLINRQAPGAFRTVQSTSFVNSSFSTARRGSAMSTAIQQPWREGRMVTDQLRIQPTSRSYAPAPDLPVSRPAASSHVSSVVRSEPSVAPSGNRGSIIRLAPGGAASSGAAQVGRGSVSPERSGAEVTSGSEFNRARGMVNRPGATSRDQTPVRPVPGTGRNAQPSQSAPAPGNQPGIGGSSRSDSANPSARSDSGRKTPSAPSSSGSRVINPPGTEKSRATSPAPRSETSPSRRVEPAPAPRNDKPATAPERSKPQPKPRSEESFYSRSTSTSAPARVEVVRPAESRVWQAPSAGVRDIQRGSWAAQSYGSAHTAPTFTPPAARGNPAPNSQGRSATGGARSH